MRILILGGAGFLGKKLAMALLNIGHLNLAGAAQEFEKLILFDKSKATDLPIDARLQILHGDISNPAEMKSLFEDPPDVIFHLAAIVSGEAEKDFDLGMQVNLDASRHLLELCRSAKTVPILVFTSSCAVFGGDVTKEVHDSTASRPRSSYGTQKAIIDLLINDYSRRAFLDGRTLRLPTVVVRPGKPNAATSSFASSIIREPLQGLGAICPVSPDTNIWIQSPKKVVDNLIHAAELDAKELGTDRILNLPGLTISVSKMVDALTAIAGRSVTDHIVWQTDPFIQSIVMTWPPNFKATRAEELGFEKDGSIEEIIEVFITEELKA